MDKTPANAPLHNLRPPPHRNRFQRAGHRIARRHLPAIPVKQGKHIQPDLVRFQPEPVRIRQIPLHRGNQLLRLRQQLKAALPVPGLKQAQLTHGPLRGGPHPEHHLIVKPIPVWSQNPAGHPSKPPGPERNAAKLRNIPRQRNRKLRSVQQPEPVQPAHQDPLAILLKRPGQPRLLLPVGKNIHKRRLQRPSLQLPLHPLQAGQGRLRPVVAPARQLVHAPAQISKRLLPAHAPGPLGKPLIPLNHMLHLV